jgi:DUF1365 family protein
MEGTVEGKICKERQILEFLRTWAENKWKWRDWRKRDENGGPHETSRKTGDKEREIATLYFLL